MDARCGARPDSPNCEIDWFRMCPRGLELGGEEVSTIDFGLPRGIWVPCKGEASLLKGLVRRPGALVGAVMMSTVLLC